MGGGGVRDPIVESSVLLSLREVVRVVLNRCGLPEIQVLDLDRDGEDHQDDKDRQRRRHRNLQAVLRGPREEPPQSPGALALPINPFELLIPAITGLRGPIGPLLYERRHGNPFDST